MAPFRTYYNSAARALARTMLMLSPLLCRGQSSLRVQHISVKEGLSQNSVNSIIQNKYGFIWIATGDGLNQFDGRGVIAHKSRFTDLSSSSLPDRNINSRLIEDDHERIWMSTDAGISYRDYRHSKHRVIVDSFGSCVILGIDKGSVWAAAPRMGIIAVNMSDLTTKLYPFSDVFQMDPARSYPVFAAALTQEGMWIADAKGLLFFDFNTHVDQRVLTRDNLYDLCLLRDKRLLLSTDNGVIVYDPRFKSETFIPVAAGLKMPKQEWWHCVEDTQAHMIYLGGSGGTVAKLDATSGRYELFNFQSSRINSLYIDRTQNLWIGTEGDGAYKLDIKPAKFRSFMPFSQKEVANGFMVKSIYQNTTGEIWIGTVDKGLWVYNPKDRTSRNIQLPVVTYGQQVGAILKDSAGSMVVAAADKIIWMDEKGNVKDQARLPKHHPSSMELPVINCLTEWKKGHYIVGTNLATYSIDATGKSIKVRFPYTLANKEWGGWTYGCYKQTDGTILLGKRNGFTKVRVLNDTSLALLDKGLNKIVIRHFYKSTTTPVLWIASEVGLVAYNEQTKQMQAIDERSGLGNSHIYAVLPENDSVLWVSTNKGISRMAVHYGDLSHIQTEVTNYTSTDGLQSDEFNTGAYFGGADGTMIFGGINGINWFDTKSIRSNPYKAIPSVAALYINDTLFAADTAHFLRSLTLPYNKNTISFSLRALEFTQPEENMFAYKLEGLDKDWVYSSADKARYSNLAPGSYTFMVKARNNEGLWNEDPFTMHVVILPPYWQTWWFRLCLALLGIAIAGVIITYLIRQRVKAKTLQLEKQQALNMERLRISKDVHDDLGAGLSKIALMAEIAQKQVMDDMTVGKDIRHISTVSKDLIDNMRDLIWVLNPENTTLDNLIARLREYCADYLDGMPLEVALSFPDEVPAMGISREAQRNIFSTVKEAVHNVVKHASATHVGITVQLNAGMLDIAICDDGKGICPDARKGNGLGNMTHRIQSIGGHCTTGPGKNSGTIVTIQIALINIRVDSRSHPKPPAVA